MTEPLPIKSVNHISRVTGALEASKAFYRDVLGFKEIPRPNFSFPGAWLYNYGVQIHLIAREQEARAKEGISIRADHVAFHVDDFQPVESRLQDHGITYEKKYVPNTGVTQIFFKDPDGNHIEIGAYPSLEELAKRLSPPS